MRRPNLRIPTRLLARSIWSPSLLEEVPPRFRGIYTVLLPLKYSLFVVFGSVTTIETAGGAIARITSGTYSDLWPVLVAAASLAALVGLIARRWALELWATFTLVALLLVYPIALAVTGLLAGNERTIGLGIGLLVFLVAPAWRISDIIRTERRRP